MAEQKQIGIFSPDKFNSVIARRNGFARPNRYMVNIMKKGDEGKGEPDLPFLCETAAFPSRSIATADQKFSGPLRKIGRESIFGELSMTFMITGDYYIKTYFDEWLNTIQNSDNYDISYYDDYISTIYVSALSPTSDSKTFPDFTKKSTDVPYAVRIDEAFPTAVTEVSLNMGEQNSYGKLQVQFGYRSWVNLK